MAVFTDHGTSLSTFQGLDGVSDLDPQFRLVSGRRAVIESLARRLMTDEGFFVEEPQYGLNLMKLLDQRVTELTLARLRPALAAQMRLDERVDEAEAQTSFVDNVLTITIEVQSAEGPFSFVMTIEDARLTLFRILDS